jgi:hypothetical protein
MMHLQPVYTYRPPAYPTRDELAGHPELLCRVPKRWQTPAILLTMLAGAGVMVLHLEHAQAAEKARVVARLAPLFPLGVDRPPRELQGDRPPPHYYSEDDARAIIVAEAKNAGITFAPDAQVVEQVRIPKVLDRWHRDDGTQTIDLTLDGTDARRKINYEYVSATDRTSWDYLKKPSSEYTTLDAAIAVRNGLMEKMPEGTTVFFYDSGYHSKDMTDEHLRCQVRAFLAWLKAEGVI